MSVRAAAGEAYREAIGPLAVSAVGGLLAGLVFAGMRSDLARVEGLVVLVPALLALRGNVYGSFGARLATGLHQGLLRPQIDDPRLRRAAAAALVDGLLAGAFGALAVGAIAPALGRPVAILPLLAIAVLAGLISGSILIVVVVAVIVTGYRRGVDPDTLVGPIVTTTGDVFGMAALLVAARLVAEVI
ncbi:MAG: magnesium transporter [Halococcoides sp.]